MEFFASDHIDYTKKKHAFDAVVVPFVTQNNKAFLFAEREDAKQLTPFFISPIQLGDFSAREGEILWVYTSKLPLQRICLLGLGSEEALSTEILRKCYAVLCRSFLDKGVKNALVYLPQNSSLTLHALSQGVVEGLLFGNYRFTPYKSKNSDSQKGVDKICFIGSFPLDVLTSAKRTQVIMNAVSMCRDLVNRNADEITPKKLAQVAKELAKNTSGITTECFGKTWLAEHGFGLVHAVAKGSSHDPELIIMHYFGNSSSPDHTVLVGKGITYDTGGINLKPSGGSIDIMKSDMAGAACVISTIKAAADLQLPVNVSCVVVACENAIGPEAYKPGDVYTSYIGKTVEITNTDAEGRLTLADAIAYTTKKLSPSRIIDIATLTGAAEVALGSEASALFSNSETLAESLIRSGVRTYERLCRLPLYDEYKEGLKSEIADIKNAGPRIGGAILAATFIKEFVGDLPWAHIDIAGTSYFKEAKRYYQKFASGVGVRLFIDFLEHESVSSTSQNASPKRKKKR